MKYLILLSLFIVGCSVDRKWADDTANAFCKCQNSVVYVIHYDDLEETIEVTCNNLVKRYFWHTDKVICNK